LQAKGYMEPSLLVYVIPHGQDCWEALRATLNAHIR
jgi:hypothetical protein